jgi:hypothetical protein
VGLRRRGEAQAVDQPLAEPLGAKRGVFGEEDAGELVAGLARRREALRAVVGHQPAHHVGHARVQVGYQALEARARRGGLGATGEEREQQGPHPEQIRAGVEVASNVVGARERGRPARRRIDPGLEGRLRVAQAAQSDLPSEAEPHAIRRQRAVHDLEAPPGVVLRPMNPAQGFEEPNSDVQRGVRRHAAAALAHRPQDLPRGAPEGAVERQDVGVADVHVLERGHDPGVADERRDLGLASKRRRSGAALHADQDERRLAQPAPGAVAPREDLVRLLGRDARDELEGAQVARERSVEGGHVGIQPGSGGVFNVRTGGG